MWGDYFPEDCEPLEGKEYDLLIFVCFLSYLKQCFAHRNHLEIDGINSFDIKKVMGKFWEVCDSDVYWGHVNELRVR